MSGASELQLIGAACTAIGLSIWLIVRAGWHPFVGLLCGAFVMGLLSGMNTQETAAAVQKGFGDVLGGAGIVIALGLTLGAMLQFSGAAVAIAEAALRAVGVRHAPWGSLVASMVIGLPLFFETGVVLLLPIIAAAAAGIPHGGNAFQRRIALMLPAMAGLSILHALLPPHPGPLLAVHELHANIGRTMLYGFLIAIPIAIIAGPPFARFASRWTGAPAESPTVAQPHVAAHPPSLAVALAVILLPVVLIGANALRELLPAYAAARLAWIAQLGSPVAALLIANLAALLLLFRQRAWQAGATARVWHEAMQPAGTILLSIGAGGALKQVLVAAGMSNAMSRFAETGLVSPLLMAWIIAVLIRLSTGSATVATITAAGMMSGVAATHDVSPEWMVLAIGAGSVFFSHVNDAGFWLVKAYLGTSTADTFKTWSLLETLISVAGLLMVLGVSRVL